MKAIIQRVRSASVKADGEKAAEISGPGIVVLLGVHRNDSPAQAEYLAAKCADFRIFEGNGQHGSLSLRDINGAALVVSQFTLYGDCTKGRRPNYSQAASAQISRPLYEYFVECIKKHVPVVTTGFFGAHMEVSFVNDGPVTLVLERNNSE